MIRLSAFADEISANLDEQIAVLHSENIHFIDLRSVEGINVLDLTDQQVTEIIILLHENEKGIYGDTIDHCVDLLQTIDDLHLRAILDPANFLQCSQVPYPDAYDFLYPWLVYIHVKDVRADGVLTPAGEGEGRWPDLLRRLHADGYDGFLALEPHLSSAGQFQGFSGPDLFRQASRALQSLLHAMNWEYR